MRGTPAVARKRHLRSILAALSLLARNHSHLQRGGAAMRADAHGRHLDVGRNGGPAIGRVRARSASLTKSSMEESRGRGCAAPLLCAVQRDDSVATTPSTLGIGQAERFESFGKKPVSYDPTYSRSKPGSLM